MKAPLYAGTGGVVSVVVAADQSLLAAIVAVALIGAALLCWLLTSERRTSNLVSVIAAVRGPADSGQGER